MQVMARAENTVFLGVEVKDTKLNIFGVHALKAKDLWVAADSSVRIGPGFSVGAKLRTVSQPVLSVFCGSGLNDPQPR